MKIIAMLMLVLLLGGCTATNQSYYEQAQLYLGAGEYRTSAALFAQLGEYRQSADYTLYALALEALREENYDLARANFMQLKDFKSSRRYLTYLDAMGLKNAGRHEDALAAFDALGSFADAPEQAAEIRKALPRLQLQEARRLMHTGDYAGAEKILEKLSTSESAALLEKCRDALMQKAVLEAQQLQESGDYAAALAAFESLSDSLQAAKHTEACRQAWRQSLTQRVLCAGIGDAEALLKELDALAHDPEAVQGAAWLREKFSVNQALLNTPGAIVSFASYPTRQTGEETPLTWEVIAYNGSCVTLLCRQVIDSLPAGDLPVLSGAENALVRLPSRQELSGLPPEKLACPATSYAVNQGVRCKNLCAWWWLADEVSPGLHAAVRHNGTVITSGVAAEESAVGVRPAAVIDLNRYFFRAGDGSEENPFR